MSNTTYKTVIELTPNGAPKISIHPISPTRYKTIQLYDGRPIDEPPENPFEYSDLEQPLPDDIDGVL